MEMKAMSIKNHRDYQAEKERLAYTKDYIEKVIDTTENNQETYKTNIKQAMEDLDYLDSSLSYINILTNAKFLEMTERDYHNLKKVRKKPYFCRIDFKPEQSEEKEKLYIGKTSLYRQEDHAPVIVDWRSPIANLYYEGRIGEVSYIPEAGEVKGELSLKRQYSINEGKLEDFQDIDITTRDELLQKSLSAKKDHRLTDIVSTIQAEQNRIIRADMDRPLIVQGVAGSGKTTIALHRIAYFIYTYAENFNPDSLMILAPNRLFISYISEVLPELGVEEVVQTTFIDFVLSCIGKKFKLVSTDEKLLTFINVGNEETSKEHHDQLAWASSFKGSLQFRDIMDRYLEELEKSFVPEEDFKLDKYVIYPAHKIKKLFEEDYTYLPLYKRLDKIKNVLSNHLKTKKKKILENLEEKYDDKIESVMYGIKDPKKRKEKVVKWMDTKEQRLAEIKQLSRTLVKDYMSQFQKRDVFDYYKEFVTSEEMIHRLSDVQLDSRNVHFLCTQSTELLNKKRIELEDTGALLYLKAKIFGIEGINIKNVVIDEAQDFSVFQLYALKAVLKTDLFTILGDLSQGIHSYRGIQDWQEVIVGVFPKSNFTTLKQSYRTTGEIMNLANQIIQQSTSPGIVLAEPVVRHGDLPVYHSFEEKNGFVSSVVGQVNKLKKEGFKTIALIGKSMEECHQIKKYMEKGSEFSTQLLKGEEQLEQKDLVIVPSYIAKGLEFDVVFIINIDDEFHAQELDIKLLYVAMTRPLHRLFIYARENKISLLDRVSKTNLHRNNE
jgi:DNA helicase-2/ATP-dependent DNA helicase PcrA